MSVAGVVLAAGFSRRLGRPKQELVIAGKTLLQRTVDVAQAAQLSPIVVVAQPGAAFLGQLQASGCVSVPNTEAAEGLASSIRAGVHVLMNEADVEGAVLMTCDQVGMTAEHLRSLSAMPNRITGSSYMGKTAVPAYFPRHVFAELLLLRGDAGARALLSEASAIHAEDLALDIDTEEDIAKAELFLRAASA